MHYEFTHEITKFSVNQQNIHFFMTNIHFECVHCSKERDLIPPRDYQTFKIYSENKKAQAQMSTHMTHLWDVS
jgi:hypothetical protein